MPNPGSAPAEQPFRPDPDEWAIDGERLRALRRGLNLSQHDLALRSGVRQQHISNMERRHTKARLGTVMNLATALGVPIPELLGRPVNQLGATPDGLAATFGSLGSPLPATSGELADRLDMCMVQVEQIQQLVDQIATVQRLLRQSLTQVDHALRSPGAPLDGHMKAAKSL